MAEHLSLPPLGGPNPLAELKHTPVSRVDQAFDAAIGWLSANDHCADISRMVFERTSECLKKRFGLDRLFGVGSHENGTGALVFSGADFFAVLDCMKESDHPKRWLTAIARELSKIFGSTEGIRADEDAVRLPFSGGRERVRIVPAIYVAVGPSGRPIYAIPGSSGRWQLASPEAHGDWLDEADARTGKKLKSLIRLTKLWRLQQDIEIESYYLELLTGSFFRQNPIGSYSYSLSSLFMHMKAFGLEALPKGGGISETVAPSKSKEARIVTLSKIDRASEWACRSVLQERYGNAPAAIEGWTLVFGGSFPRFHRTMAPARA